MALFDSQIGTVRYNNATIDHYLTYADVHCGGLPDIMNTFNYVVNNLRSWADDTTVGAETLESFKNLNLTLEKLFDSTKNLSASIEEFANKQAQINKGGM